MAEKWRCGDCGCKWSSEITSCPHKFDDYLGVRDVGSIDEAMAKHLAPIFTKFDRPVKHLLNGKSAGGFLAGCTCGAFVDDFSKHLIEVA